MNLNKEQLELKVNDISSKYGSIKLGELLAGGVVSDIYAATLTDKEGKDNSIVVKYTKDDIPISHIFSKTDIENSFSKALDTHNLDVDIQSSIKVTTPQIIEHYPNDHITLMVNFNDQGYMLLQNLILEDNLPEDSFVKMAKLLSDLGKELKESKGQYPQVEASRTQFDERFYELKALLYNGRMDMFNQIESDFLESENIHFVWTDGDQKNIAIDEVGNAMIFDMGRSIICDPDFMLPNLLGHLGLFYIAGYLDENTKQFRDAVDIYIQEGNSINETKFVSYFTASVLHRGMAMRWIDPRVADRVGADSMKNACMHLGDIVFDKDYRLVNIDQLFDLLHKIRVLALAQKYRRVGIN
jgi:hypothetical protein